MLLFSQIVTSVPQDPLITEWIIRAAQTAAGFAIVWLVRVVARLDKKIDKWDVVFFGLKGDNGMYSEHKTLMKEREEGMRGHRRATDLRGHSA